MPPPRRRPVYAKTPSNIGDASSTIEKAIDFTILKQRIAEPYTIKPPPIRQVIVATDSSRRLLKQSEQHLDIKLKAQNVAIINADSLFDHSVLRPHRTMPDSSEPIDPFENVGIVDEIDQHQLAVNGVDTDTNSIINIIEPETSTIIEISDNNKWTNIDLAEHIMSSVSFDNIQLESQVVNVHDLETFRNSISTTNRWCIRN